MRIDGAGWPQRRLAGVTHTRKSTYSTHSLTACAIIAAIAACRVNSNHVHAVEHCRAEL